MLSLVIIEIGRSLVVRILEDDDSIVNHMLHLRVILLKQNFDVAFLGIGFDNKCM